MLSVLKHTREFSLDDDLTELRLKNKMLHAKNGDLKNRLNIFEYHRRRDLLSDSMPKEYGVKI